MSLKKKIFIFAIFICLVSIIGASSALSQDNNDDLSGIALQNNETDIGCCSIVWQLDGSNTIMSHRRDSNLDADIHIENVDWHGYNVIKQYKTDNKYFCHVIITSDGWVIGLGGTDDGVDNEKAENITANMINKDNTISEADLKEIQKIKIPYGKGHVVIKAPNGNYGFATVDKVKTGKLEPGQYISIPNDYNDSRADTISPDVSDKIGVMDNLSRSDNYGVDRREIVIYDFKTGENANTTDIYVSNEDGALVGVDNSIYIDDIYLNDTLIKGKDIPVAPEYKEIGSITFDGGNNLFSQFLTLIFMAVFAIFVAVLGFIIYRFIRSTRNKNRR